MGAHGGGDGGWPPDGGGSPAGVPGLPPEWGTIIIPDDPADLATEAAQVRRELHGSPGRRLSPDTAGGISPPPRLAAPVLAIILAVLVTLTGLFSLSLFGMRGQEPAARPPVADRPLPELTLTDADGRPVPLHQGTPTVLLLTDGCECGQLILATAAAAPPGATVLAVAGTAPTLPGPVESDHTRVRLLADPDARLRAALGPQAQRGGVTVVLVSRRAEILRIVASVRTLADFRGALAELDG